MEFILFLKAALVGVSIAAPVGPIGLICIQRTLAQGARVGFLSGLGAACADAIYGAIGALGLTVVMQWFAAIQVPLTLVGTVFLAWLGLQLLRKPASVDPQVPSRSDERQALKAFLTVFALTLASPVTILSFVAVFAAIGGELVAEQGSVLVMVLGVFVGSALWWLTLAGTVARIRHRLTARMLQRISQGAGVFLVGFALWQLIKLF